MPPVEGGSPEGGRIDHRHEPALGRSLGAPAGARRQPRPGRVDERPPRRRRRHDLRDRQGLRLRPAGGDAAGTRPRVVAARPRRRPVPRDPPSWDRPARPYDLDDAKGAIELHRAAPGLRRVDVRAARAASRCSIRAARRRVRGQRDGRLALAGWVGELHPGDRRGVGPARGPRRRRGARHAASAAGACAAVTAARRRVTRPPSATSRSSSPRSRPAGEVAAAIRAHGGAVLSIDAQPVRRLPRRARSARTRRASPSG